MVCAGDHLGRGWAGRAGRGGDAGPSGFYDLTDAMFSVRAITDSAGLLHTRLDYTPYGVAMHGLAADVNGDGALTFTDISLASINDNGGTPLVPGDTNYDPDADLWGAGADYYSFLPRYTDYSAGPTFNAGWIDNPNDANGSDNSVGYNGYWFDMAGATNAASSGLYYIRFRVYDPGTGRWLEQDPANFVDGSNRLLYARSVPTRYLDTSGLSATEPSRNHPDSIWQQIRREQGGRGPGHSGMMEVVQTISIGIEFVEDIFPSVGINIGMVNTINESVSCCDGSKKNSCRANGREITIGFKAEASLSWSTSVELFSDLGDPAKCPAEGDYVEICVGSELKGGGVAADIKFKGKACIQLGPGGWDVSAEVAAKAGIGGISGEFSNTVGTENGIRTMANLAYRMSAGFGADVGSIKFYSVTCEKLNTCCTLK